MLFSWICVGMWLTIEWAYFANTLRKPVNKHISHFCVKTAGAVYSWLFLFFLKSLCSNLPHSNIKL